MTIEIATFGDFVRYGYSMRVYCDRCKHSRVIDLKRCDPSRAVANARFRCSACGGTGRAIVSPPGMSLGIPDSYGMEL